ncbi:putative membrane protein YedE/YeeE [Mesorhizobium soli]|uniref:YeeE/YedE family protein n=1 Tax=Pseudaminobacter soli (ex Li et al. 2025) TaxID=1295366 RepID=UPI0024757B61|nr:YeeE/YedE family protein [Mesorhizobium soli]MDH6232024.1 putative membrane protein YedE/YeeE [Mesorhizobium soli]
MTEINAALRAPAAPINLDKGPVVVAVLAFVLGALAIGEAISPRQALLFLIGGLLGMTLYHASFGFTGGWRRFVVEQRGRAIRAQMLMIAAAAVVFIPLLASGSINGQPLSGAFAPVGVSVLVGAAMFGLGMQLGGGCGSGTLFTVGGGSSRMLVTLIFFIVGAVIGTAHLPWWLAQPSVPQISLGSALGVPGGVIVTLAGLGAVAALTVLIERRAHGSLEQVKPASEHSFARLLQGPWPLFTAGLGLAALNIATLVTAGHPWSVTFGFGLWGAKIAQAVGIPVETWDFWNWPGPAKALGSSVLADVTSVMNFGIILGAAFAAGLAGKFAPKVHVPFASFLAAAIGGVLMGYGARLSFGCNVGALFSGIASGSVHGWLWFASAFVGSLGGVALRPLFGLDGFNKK